VSAHVRGAAVTSPVPRQAWNAALKADGGALVSQSLAWRDAVFAAGRHADASRLYQFDSGQQVVLPLASRRGLPPGCGVMTSWPPTAEIGGPICAGGEIGRPEAAAILADLARLNALSVEIRLRADAGEHWLAAATGWRVERHDYYVLDLRGGFDDVWNNRFRSSVRGGVRKAERAHLEIETGRSALLLDEFCQLYDISIRRWAAGRHEPAWLARKLLSQEMSRQRLDRMAKHFGDDLTVWMARVKGQPAAALVVLKFGSYAKYWRGAMDKDLAGPVQANNLLHRRAIEQACETGYSFYDMGLGDAPTLIAFKQKLGAVARQTHTLRRQRLPIHATRLYAESAVKRAIGVRG
jgi:CelD/BcsL family acetyltransferase involved in cellulose biosynthesis